jgi:hypothetical protein
MPIYGVNRENTGRFEFLKKKRLATSILKKCIIIIPARTRMNVPESGIKLRSVPIGVFGSRSVIIKISNDVNN